MSVLRSSPGSSGKGGRWSNSPEGEDLERRIRIVNKQAVNPRNGSLTGSTGFTGSYLRRSGTPIVAGKNLPEPILLINPQSSPRGFQKQSFSAALRFCNRVKRFSAAGSGLILSEYSFWRYGVRIQVFPDVFFDFSRSLFKLVLVVAGGVGAGS